MGTASIHRRDVIRNGAASREGHVSVSVSPPLAAPYPLAPSRNLFAKSTTTLSSEETTSHHQHRTAWVEAGPLASKEQSESFVEGMRRVLGSLHIKGVSAEKLHRGRTPKQDAPFANCTAVLDPPLSVVIIGSGFGESVRPK